MKLLTQIKIIQVKDLEQKTSQVVMIKLRR